MMKLGAEYCAQMPVEFCAQNIVLNIAGYCAEYSAQMPAEGSLLLWVGLLRFFWVLSFTEECKRFLIREMILGACLWIATE